MRKYLPFLIPFSILLFANGCRGREAVTDVRDELSIYAREDRSGEGGEVLFLSFDDRPKGLSVPKGYIRRGGEGVNGTGGLMLACPNGGKRTPATLRVKGLRQGVKYRLSAQVCVNGLKVDGLKRTEAKFKPFGFDFYSAAGKCTCSRYAQVAIRDGELPWTTVSVDFSLPDDTNCEADLIFFAKAHFSATRIAWDNVKLERLGRIQPVMYPISPKRLQIGADGYLQMRVASFREGKDAAHLVLFARRADGVVVKSPVVKGCAEFKFGRLPQGKSRIAFFLADESTKKILAEDTYPFIAGDGELMRRGCEMDASGRMLVDGKPFFPLGFVVEQPVRLTEYNIREMRAAGVNMIIPYRSIQFSLPENQPPFGLAKVRKSLDYLNERGIKVVFSLLEITDRIHHVDRYEGLTDKKAIAERIVCELKDHPGLLGWFIADENPVGELGKVRALREQVAMLDPLHPIIGCAVRAEDYLWFGPELDVLMVDNYPIWDNDEPSHSMRWIRHAFVTQRDQCKMGLWWMQQGFHWGVYHRSRKYASFRYPEEEEMCAQVLLSLNFRARSVGFYAWDSIRRQDEDDPGSSVWFKPRVLNAIRFAHELEPFFLADAEPEAVTVTNAKGPLVEAKRHVAGNRVAVAVTSDGPGKAAARVKVGVDGLKSRFGRLRDLGNGDYEFTADGMSGDVLIY